MAESSDEDEDGSSIASVDSVLEKAGKTLEDSRRKRTAGGMRESLSSSSDDDDSSSSPSSSPKQIVLQVPPTTPRMSPDNDPTLHHFTPSQLAAIWSQPSQMPLPILHPLAEGYPTQITT